MIETSDHQNVNFGLFCVPNDQFITQTFLQNSLFESPFTLDMDGKWLREGLKEKKCGIFCTLVGWVGLKKSFSTKKNGFKIHKIT